MTEPGDREILDGAAYFLVPDLPAAGPFLLDGPEGRHAAAVRRFRAGQVLVLTDGRGGLAPATVVAAGRSELDLVVGPGRRQAPRSPRVVLVQAIPKGERGELAVDLATEAGIDEIVPWAASRCIARWTSDKAERGVAKWQGAAQEAAKQARRAWVPVVRPVASTAQVSALIGAAAGAVILHEAASVPLTSVALPTSGDLVLVVGPEGGVSPDEIAAFIAAGACAVRLGPEVLRTSAAAAVALGALGVLTGRWDQSDANEQDTGR